MEDVRICYEVSPSGNVELKMLLKGSRGHHTRFAGLSPPGGKSANHISSYDQLLAPTVSSTLHLA
jgi:hypothetical protein